MNKLFGCFALAVVPLAIPAHATIVTSSYEVGYLVKPPASVVPGALRNNSFLNMFSEVFGFKLTSPLAVDINTPNVVYDQRTQITTGAQIPEGTVLNSYYVHANVAGSNIIKFVDQYIGFSEEEQVLGVMVLAPTIEAANPIVGAPGTTYDTTLAGIGLHLEPTGKDFIVLQPATTAAPANTVTFREYVSPASVTDFRIITTIVPTGSFVRNGGKQ
jgi:hypothetical protein